MASTYEASPAAAASLPFGAWLRELREAKGLAQRAVAAAVDMDSSHYGKVESGKRLLTDEQVAPAAACLGVPVTDLRLRLVAARMLQAAGGDAALAHSAASVVQETAAPYLVDNPVNKRTRKK